MEISEDLLLVFRKLTLFLKIGFNIIRWEKIEKKQKKTENPGSSVGGVQLRI